VLNRSRESSVIKVVDTELGSPTDCESLSEFIFELIKKPVEYGIYNFSNDQPMSWFGFAKIIENVLNPQGLLIQKTSDFKTLAKRPKMSVLSNKKRKRVWEKATPLKLKIKAYISLLHS
jgi:dTDP-4-dehydrorhamnose reductase